VSYVLDASYADTFFQELSPAWLNYARAINGVPQKPLDRPFTYLELGAGFGHSTVVNAAACPHGEFHACDFNPEHIAGGRRYADALDLTNVQFHEASFESLATTGLPEFDFIVLHGVYSWVGAASRTAIRRIIRDKLAPGGLVYVSYNCMPGWAAEMPVRRLLVELASASTGDSADKMRHAVETLAQMSRNTRFFEANPEAARAIESYEKVPANYLAHEFLNETWQPFYSVDVADEMAADAQVSLLGSATLADNHPMLVLDEASAQALKSLATPRQLHLAMDFAANRRFRRDLFVRSDTSRTPADAARTLPTAIIGSVGEPSRIPDRVKVPRGQFTFQPDFIEALKRLLSAGSTTLGEATLELGGQKRNTADLVRNLAFLVAGGALMPYARVDRYQPPAEVWRPANALVEKTLALIIEQRAPRAIPSEVLGNGVLVRPLEALAIIELLGGAPLDDALAERIGQSAKQLQFETSENIPDVLRQVSSTLLPRLARLRLLS
jgi:predicted O-methyltransferase YrrM